MDKKINVLIYPAGEINAVELHDALSTCVNIKVYGASSIDRHGSFVFKNYLPNAPLITDTDFFEKFNKIVHENNIDVIFPTHDTVAEFFALNKNKINAVIINSDEETSVICRDKAKIYNILKEEHFCPKVYEKFEKFPLFIKPRKGQGAVGTKIINCAQDIPKNINFNDYVITEYLPGEELTVDCLSDCKGKLMAVLPRTRDRIMAGVCMRGRNIQANEEIIHIAEIINSKLKLNGLWFFQIKKDVNNKFKLLEISTRCAGTMCLSRAMGVNLPLLSVYIALNKNIDVFKNTYNLVMDRNVIARYKMDYDYERVYLDFDDTLIIDNKIHLPSIRFVYQCKNQKKEVVLITRHEKNIFDTLRNYALSEHLFDRIIKISFDDEKYKYINPEKAIFVDNSFAERKKIHDTYKIPVFDVDGLEVLTDWRQ